ncbi:Rhodanese-like protein [Sporormia fimetaria CBS 119925]|uniref:M-phase inducer phosphatase n=1 Tax=Sporormia fimetaria CBS 119925 TaxID=1340428 RepID=A0A6A6V990_9PLEO|nr:Rhodanese-like protein [Sporormia fimetaria CBS 119925]
MDMSSPLAAMHPPPLPGSGPWANARDLPASALYARKFGQDSFNFRDMSMKKFNPDYFALNPARGSSPTASLAADMSSNLHVDNSPQYATPRRTLFTSFISKALDKQAEGTTTPPIRWEGVTTPDVPSSSPFVPDTMDISPLPHKAPFSFVQVQQLPSPSPQLTPSTDEDMLSPCELPGPPKFPLGQLEIQRPASALERRKFQRPTLTRAKNYSTNTVSFKSKELNPPPTFTFGAVQSTSGSGSNTPSSLDECFTESPQERKVAPSFLAPRPRPLNLNTNVSRIPGAPLSANVRKPTGPPNRPRSKFRRSLSMFENPGDVMNQQEDDAAFTPSTLQSVMDMDDVPALKLPNFTPPNEPDSLPRINEATMISVLNGDFDHLYEKKVIIDCRFEYEYEGGHIQGARNFCEKEYLAEELFANPSPNTLLIFHCEYSVHRAPLMAKFVRHEDRRLNAFRYPQLSYPEVYILDGGYSKFYESNSTRCFPQSYLPMNADEHRSACERGMNKLRQRSKLNRAQTFAFGQSPQMEDSPTAAGRSKSSTSLMLGQGDSLNVGRIGATRRTASY